MSETSILERVERGAYQVRTPWSARREDVAAHVLVRCGGCGEKLDVYGPVPEPSWRCLPCRWGRR